MNYKKFNLLTEGYKFQINLFKTLLF